MMTRALLLLLPLLVHGKVMKETLVLEEWVVDYLRPTVDRQDSASILPFQHPAARKSPFDIPDAQRSVKYLVNGSYPGPTLRAMENDTFEITVVNNLFSEATTIHWHGIHPFATPYMDGARGVTQGPIGPGENFTYRFAAWPPGTHFYHSHMDAVQASRGVRGGIVVDRADDPVRERWPDYEDQLVWLADEWRDPSACLKLEGAVPGNDVCADMRHASFNGAYGNGSDAYPYPLLPVKKDTCYRMRFVLAGSNTENLIVAIAGHNMTLVSLDGAYDVEPLAVSSFNMHLTERYDVMLCADQAPGNYVVNATYDYACALTAGHFIPPGFATVPECVFHAFLHYDEAGVSSTPQDLGGTEGGARPAKVAGVPFDLTQPSHWNLTRPLVSSPEKDEADFQITLNLGIQAPTYGGPTDRPLTKGRWYFDLKEQDPPRPWVVPRTPLYMTKGTCGLPADIPVIDIPENATTVEVVIQNLSPNAHVLHLHGMPFKVVNVADFTSWCGLEQTSCFTLPWWSPFDVLNKCPTELRTPGDPDRKTGDELSFYWGCAYDPETDVKTRNLETPLLKDVLQVWQRSWTVIRFEANRPGYWYFHCHETQHLMLGLQVVFNVLPSQQPPVPDDVPSSGSCPTVHGVRADYE